MRPALQSAHHSHPAHCRRRHVQAADTGCPDARSHQFDFWIGNWEVTNADDTVAGHNRIEPILDGCVLQETWAGVSGSAGTSLNFFDTSRNKWRQFWVWREGTTLELEGGSEQWRHGPGGRLRRGDGKPARNRITWTDRSGATVHQVWEVSKDEGKSWETIFSGTYWPEKQPGAG